MQTYVYDCLPPPVRPDNALLSSRNGFRKCGHLFCNLFSHLISVFLSKTSLYFQQFTLHKQAQVMPTRALAASFLAAFKFNLK